MKQNKKINFFLGIILIASLLIGICRMPTISQAVTNASSQVSTAALNTQLIQMLIEMIRQLQVQLQQLIANKAALTTTVQCGWCGNSCINWAGKDRSSTVCADVMPPTGAYCQNVNGICQITNNTTKYSCSTVMGTIPSNNYTGCIPSNNGTFNSLAECQNVCPITTTTTSASATTSTSTSSTTTTIFRQPVSVLEPIAAGCSWCGNTCVLSSTLVGKQCATVIPPAGSTCTLVNGVCTTSNGGVVEGVETHIFSENLGYGMENDDVKALQSILTAKGYFSSIISGYFGWQTEEAVKAFQSANNLPATGLVGPLTRELLNK